MNKCIVCGSDRAGILYPGILKCRECGLAFADVRITDESLSRLYGRGYFFGEEYSDYLSDKEVLQKNFALRLRTLHRFLLPDRHRRVLEIGSAYGFFLEVARRRFDTVLGFDISEDGVRHAREALGLRAIQADFLEYDLGSEEYDLVCLWDTLEHLRAPHGYIEKIERHVRSGALLAITTGDIDSMLARIRGARWRLIHPPTHLYYFSRRTLSLLLEKHGFEVVYMRHCGFYRSAENIAYNVLMLRRKWPRLYHILRRTRITHMGLYSNTYDILYVIARKK